MENSLSLAQSFTNTIGSSGRDGSDCDGFETTPIPFGHGDDRL